MKHTHWSFKANTETFDGKRAVKEAYAAGLQIVSFETETHAVTLATEEFIDRLAAAGIPFDTSDRTSGGYVWVPTLSASTLDCISSCEDDLPPYTFSLNHTAAEVREMIAALRRPQRVSVSGYGPEVSAEAEAPEPRAVDAETPTAPFVWQGEGVYTRRNGDRARIRARENIRANATYEYVDEDGDTYCAAGQYYAAADGGSPIGLDLVGGKVADL